MHKKKGNPSVPPILLYRNTRARVIFSHCQREKISVRKKTPTKIGKQLSPMPVGLWGQMQSTSCKLTGVLLWPIQWLWCIQSRLRQQFHIQTINSETIRVVPFVQPKYVNTGAQNILLKSPSQGKSEVSLCCILAKDLRGFCHKCSVLVPRLQAADLALLCDDGVCETSCKQKILPQSMIA